MAFPENVAVTARRSFRRDATGNEAMPVRLLTAIVPRTFRPAENVTQPFGRLWGREILTLATSRAAPEAPFARTSFVRVAMRGGNLHVRVISRSSTGGGTGSGGVIAWPPPVGERQPRLT